MQCPTGYSTTPAMARVIITITNHKDRTYSVALVNNTHRQVHRHISLQCFDTADWTTGRTSGLQETGCWFVGGDDLTAALQVFQLQLSPPPLSSLAPMSMGTFLVPANPGPPGKMAVKIERDAYRLRELKSAVVL